MIISIDYDEGNQESYRGVEISGENGTHVFGTGHPELDYAMARIFCEILSSEPIMLSSSCDHFVMDGDEFEWIETEYGTLIVRTR